MGRNEVADSMRKQILRHNPHAIITSPGETPLVKDNVAGLPRRFRTREQETTPMSIPCVGSIYEFAGRHEFRICWNVRMGRPGSREDGGMKGTSLGPRSSFVAFELVALRSRSCFSRTK